MAVCSSSLFGCNSVMVESSCPPNWRCPFSHLCKCPRAASLCAHRTAFGTETFARECVEKSYGLSWLCICLFLFGYKVWNTWQDSFLQFYFIMINKMEQIFLNKQNTRAEQLSMCVVLGSFLWTCTTLSLWPRLDCSRIWSLLESVLSTSVNVGCGSVQTGKHYWPVYWLVAVATTSERRWLSSAYGVWCHCDCGIYTWPGARLEWS